MSDFIKTTAIKKIGAMQKRIKGVQGGTSAGKTFGIIPREINYCCKYPNTETSIVSESFPHLRRGALKDFKAIMKKTGRWNPARWNATESKYTFYNGSFIEFFSADNDSKLRGARRTRLYINEANNIKFEAYQELAVRTSGSITLDWNPTAPFWFHEHLQERSDCEFLIINYLDNEACPQNAIDEIELAKELGKTSPYWLNWYNVYGLGLLGSLENMVFSDWKQINKIPKTATLVGYGLDFGYSQDPTALVSVWRWNGRRIIHEEIYEKGLLNIDIYNRVKHKWATIYADCAEPKSIAELNKLGLKVFPVEKGADSIKYGINVIHQQGTYYVTQESTNIIKELRAYRYIKGKVIDAFNHAMDAWRYHEMMSVGGGRKNYSKAKIT